MSNLTVICGKVPRHEAEAFDKWAKSLNMTRSTGLRYIISNFLYPPQGDKRANQLSKAAELSKREGVIEGIRIFREAFSRAADEAMAKVLEDEK